MDFIDFGKPLVSRMWKHPDPERLFTSIRIRAANITLYPGESQDLLFQDPVLQQFWRQNAIAAGSRFN